MKCGRQWARRMASCCDGHGGVLGGDSAKDRAMWQGRQRTFVRDPSDARHYYVRKGKDGVHIISSGSTIIIR